MDFLKGSELRCSLPALDKLIQPCHWERKGERERGNGVTTVFSSILDTFFFNGKGERDYQTSGCETSVPDPNTFWATERELLIHELEPQFHFPSPEASCTGLLLYLVGSATWVRPPGDRGHGWCVGQLESQFPSPSSAFDFGCCRPVCL